MLEAMAEWMSYPMYYTIDGQPPPARTGAAHATIYPYGPFACGDGKTVMLGVQNEREWAAFCETVLEQPELAAHPDFKGNAQRQANRERLRGIIEGEFAKLTGAQLVERLEAAQIANARLNEMSDVWNHAQLRARERWSEIGSPVGPLPALWPPHHAAGEGGEPPRMDAVPALGQHTDSILAELGYASEHIARLRAAEAI
jgi:itaconate CoA-transferase